MFEKCCVNKSKPLAEDSVRGNFCESGCGAVKLLPFELTIIFAFFFFGFLTLVLSY